MDTAVKVIVGAIVALAGLLGLFLHANAVDSGIQIFGGLLFVFAVLLNFWFIKGHYDALDAKAAK
jgi:protein-S-isoprenylcysteine O-methyltransferase Ste14